MVPPITGCHLVTPLGLLLNGIHLWLVLMYRVSQMLQRTYPAALLRYLKDCMKKKKRSFFLTYTFKNTLVRWPGRLEVTYVT